MVVIFRRPGAVVAHIQQAAAKHAETVWLPSGTWSREAQEAARTRSSRTGASSRNTGISPAQGGSPTAGHPRKQGVHLRRRGRRIEEDQVTSPDAGYVEGGGGGHKAGGGKHSVLDEKKMMSGRRNH
jgi:hypothetical protein